MLLQATKIRLTVPVAVVGPEEDYNQILMEEMSGTKWHGTVVGYGLRSAKAQDLTVQLEGKFDPEFLASQSHTDRRSPRIPHAGAVGPGHV